MREPSVGQGGTQVRASIAFDVLEQDEDVGLLAEEGGLQAGSSPVGL